MSTRFKYGMLNYIEELNNIDDVVQNATAGAAASAAAAAQSAADAAASAGQASVPLGNIKYSYADYSVATATYVPITLPTSGQTLAAGYSYRVELTTLGTATSSGAVYVIREQSAGVWNLTNVSNNGTTSNHPLLRISVDGTKLEIYHNHPSTYTIRAAVKSIFVGINTVAQTIFGLEGVISNIAGIVITPNLQVGRSTAGTGNQGIIKYYKDTGALAWSAGVDGANGGVNYVLFDIVGNAARQTVAPDGTTTFAVAGNNRLGVTTNGISVGGSFTGNNRVSVASGSDSSGAGDGIAFYGFSTNKQAEILSYNTGAYNGDLRFFVSTKASASTATTIEAMRINANGNLSVGTTTDNGTKVHVSGNVSITGRTWVNGITDYTGFNSGLVLNYTGGGTQFGMVFKPASSPSVTNAITFLTGASTAGSPVQLASIEHLGSDAGMNLSGVWKLGNNTILTANSPTATGTMTVDNLTFSGTGRKIIADFSNGTVANRTFFQSNTSNATTTVGILPNGTSTTAYLTAYNNSTPTNAAICNFGVSSAAAFVTSGVSGTGTQLPLQLVIGSTVAMNITTGNDIGLFGGTPTSSGTAYRTLALGAGTTGSAGSIIEFRTSADVARGTIASNTSGAVVLNNEGSTLPLLFYTGSAERMRLTNGGYLCLGSANADPITSRTAGAAISTTGSSNGNMHIRCANNQLDLQIAASSGGNIQFYTDNGSTFVSAGNISSNSTTTSYNTSSDYRLKTEVVPMTGALDSLKQIRFKTWKWGSDGRNGEGIIAHELQAIDIPIEDAVWGDKDEVDEYGNPKYQSADYSKLVPRIGCSVQELNEKLEIALEKISVLESILVGQQ